ncbi:MAG TPA: ABC transporter permease subunit [Isosphaeraceae bacterium]
MEQAPAALSPPPALRLWRRSAALLALLLIATTTAHADTLADVRSSGRLTYGSDEEGGAPYLYLDRNPPHARIGFEAELMERIARELNVTPVFKQALWENLLQVLARGEIDVVVNGYELTERRARDYLATRPYYVFQLQLLALPGGPVHSLADFALPRPGGGVWQLGVLGNSAADVYARRLDPRLVRVVRFDGATNAMMKVRSGQIDATLQDLPAALHYVRQPEFAGLALAGPPEGCGYYVMYLRKGDEALRDAIDDAIGKVVRSGQWKAICERYHIWNDAQAVLADWKGGDRTGADTERPWFDWHLLRDFFPDLLLSAGVTLALSFGSMPIAIVLGLFIALGRLYGPRWVATPLSAYVEVIRGTPLMLQLFVLFYVLPELGVMLSPWAAGIAGLAINYSAYESEIYRAGLQAIPKGQMEAALALGMSRKLALRRVIVPQAVRIVIPPVTSDFIALFKDTSICSVLTLTELTKRYSILSNTVGGVVEFGIATAVLYLAMSLPLSWFSRWMERRLDAEGVSG